MSCRAAPVGGIVYIAVRNKVCIGQNIPVAYPNHASPSVFHLCLCSRLALFCGMPFFAADKTYCVHPPFLYPLNTTVLRGCLTSIDVTLPLLVLACSLEFP